MFGEILFVFESGPVDTLELGVRGVAFVEGTCDAHDLEGLAVPGAGNVRAGAEIPEVTILIKRDRLAFGDVLEEINLETAWNRALPEGGETTRLRQFEGLGTGDFAFLEDLIFLHDREHLGLDLFEVVGRDAMGKIDVVVKPVFHRRPGRELRIGPELRNRRREDVRAGVAQALQFRHLVALVQ